MSRDGPRAVAERSPGFG